MRGVNVRSLLLRGNLRGSVHLGSQGTGEQSPMLMLVDTIRILRGINIFSLGLLPVITTVVPTHPRPEDDRWQTDRANSAETPYRRSAFDLLHVVINERDEDFCEYARRNGLPISRLIISKVPESGCNLWRESGTTVVDHGINVSSIVFASRNRTTKRAPVEATSELAETLDEFSVTHVDTSDQNKEVEI